MIDNNNRNFVPPAIKKKEIIEVKPEIIEVGNPIRYGNEAPQDRASGVVLRTIPLIVITMFASLTGTVAFRTLFGNGNLLLVFLLLSTITFTVGVVVINVADYRHTAEGVERLRLNLISQQIKRTRKWEKNRAQNGVSHR